MPQVLKLKTELGKSCLWGMSLQDTKDAELLLEAHLFQGLAFRGGAVAVFVSGGDQVKVPDDTTRPLNGSDWQAVQANSPAFAAKHGLRLTFVD